MRRAKLEDLCITITDGSHNPPKGVNKSEYLMLSSKNVYDDCITYDEPRYLSAEEYELENKRTNITAGDVLLTIVGTVGRCAVVPQGCGNLVLQRSVSVLKPRKDICDSRYLMYALISKRASFESEARGVAQKGIYLKQLSRVEIPVPSLQDQRGIICLLDKVQSIITARKQQITELDRLVKARFVEMFGDCLTNPKGWKTKFLEDIAEVGSSKRVFVEELQEEGIPFYRGTEVGALAEGKPITPELFITEQHYTELCKATGAPQIGDLLMPSICPDGRIWVVNTDAPFYFKDGRVLWVHAIDSSYNPIFLLYTLKDRIMTDYSSIASGTTFAELKIFALKKCRIFDVPLENQNQFAAFIEQTDKSKALVQKALDEAQTLFDSLMQQYFG